MNWQILIVGLIISLALLYIGKMIWSKMKSFSGKSSCAAGCGCDSKQTVKNNLS